MVKRNITRRTALKTIGSGLALGSVGITAADQPTQGRLRKLGHSLLSDPPGAFAEESVRADGKYAVVGSVFGPGGSFLVDIRNPTNPQQVHHVPSPSFGTLHLDVKFDHRNGIYYRGLEGDNTGVDVIDYGFGSGTPENPQLVVTMDAGPTHNLFPHPEAPIVYTVNHALTSPGIDVWDVSDPTNPQLHDTAGPNGEVHDLVVDPVRNLAHLAYVGPKTALDAYVILDASDPWNPVEIGRFDYAGFPDYDDVPIGTETFENCHYTNYDPYRDLVIVGDELAFGNPGGKHVFDIGWGDGSPSDPQPIGYTLSPNATVMDEPLEIFDWTGHNFDTITKGSHTFLVSGDYHDGLVAYDITDPTNPTAVDQYLTVDDADQANQIFFPVGDPPMTWGADYVHERDLVVVSDMVTGFYVFKFTPSASG